jgi:hypothetical protein
MRAIRMRHGSALVTAHNRKVTLDQDSAFEMPSHTSLARAVDTSSGGAQSSNAEASIAQAGDADAIVSDVVE